MAVPPALAARRPPAAADRGGSAGQRLERPAHVGPVGPPGLEPAPSPGRSEPEPLLIGGPRPPCHGAGREACDDSVRRLHGEHLEPRVPDRRLARRGHPCRCCSRSPAAASSRPTRRRRRPSTSASSACRSATSSIATVLEAARAAARRHVEYAWVSAITERAPNSGFYGLDDRTCWVKVVAGRNGKIVAATIVEDMPGRTSTSRCLEVFEEA